MSSAVVETKGLSKEAKDMFRIKEGTDVLEMKRLKARRGEDHLDVMENEEHVFLDLEESDTDSEEGSEVEVVLDNNDGIEIIEWYSSESEYSNYSEEDILEQEDGVQDNNLIRIQLENDLYGNQDYLEMNQDNILEPIEEEENVDKVFENQNDD